MSARTFSRRSFLQGMGLAGAGVYASALSLTGCSTMPQKTARWWKGNLHMHTFWSDGQAFPEEAIDIYRSNGYQFLSLTDHNRFADKMDEWRPVGGPDGKWPPNVTQKMFDRYMKTHKAEVDTRTRNGKLEVRVKTYAEMQKRTDKPDNFALLPGMEITQVLGGPLNISVHMNTINLPGQIPSLKGKPLVVEYKDSTTASQLINHNWREVTEQGTAMKRPYLLTLNHPFWVYCDIVPQDLIDNPGIRFFEISNGGTHYLHRPEVASYQPDVFWDAVNAFRRINGKQLIFGQGVDDTHSYDSPNGKAWIMVRSAALDTESIIAAMHAGDFYVTNGATLADVSFDPRQKRLSLEVKPENNAQYEIRFIVTKKGFDQRVSYSQQDPAPGEKRRQSRRIPLYSKDVGITAKLVKGLSGSYEMADDDLYVRAKVISSTPSRAEYLKNFTSFYPQTLTAWTQPYC